MLFCFFKSLPKSGCIVEIDSNLFIRASCLNEKVIKFSKILRISSMFSSIDSPSISNIAFCILALIFCIFSALFFWFFLTELLFLFFNPSSALFNSWSISFFSSSTSGNSIGSFNLLLSFVSSFNSFFIFSKPFFISF